VIRDHTSIRDLLVLVNRILKITTIGVNKRTCIWKVPS
jgi:hypothetical protein